MKEFLEKYDDTDTVTAIESNRLHITYRPYPKLFTKTVDRPLKYEFTSWGVLYRLLRANFDGFASKPFPNPPPRRAADGKATYLTGAYVVNLNLSGDKVIVHYLDESTGEEVDLTADLLIGADGVHSTVRKIVKAPTVREYAGMVAWRGTVPQSELSEATAKFFADGLVYDMMQHAYILW
jgi:2-polyprenyl-6-methoxyphenol hydroxylase-like FAD-dependent oxidoreductase